MPSCHWTSQNITTWLVVSGFYYGFNWINSIKLNFSKNDRGKKSPIYYYVLSVVTSEKWTFVDIFNVLVSFHKSNGILVTYIQMWSNYTTETILGIKDLCG